MTAPFRLSIAWGTDAIAQDPDTGESSIETTEHLLQFDATTSEIHTGTATVPEHAIEGGLMSDHKRADMATLSIEGVVSNTPIDEPGPSGYGFLTGPTLSEKGDWSEAFDRVGDVMATLERLRSEPTLVTVFTKHRTYPRMTVVAVTAPRETRGSIRFQVELVEVRVVRTSLVDSPEPREPRGSRTANAGAQEAAEVVEDSPEGSQLLNLIQDEDSAVGNALNSATGGFFRQ